MKTKVKLTSSLEPDAPFVECLYFKKGIFYDLNNLFFNVELKEDVNFFPELTTVWGEKIQNLYIIKLKDNENP